MMLNPTFVLAAFCIGVLASFALPNTGLLAQQLMLLCASSLVILITRKTRIFQAAFLVFILIIGVQYGILRTKIALQQQYPVSLNPPSIVLTATVSELPETDYTTGHTQFIGIARTADGKHYRLLFHDYHGGTWHVGETWQFSARVRAAIGTHNPVGFNREAWALANQIDGIASVSKQRFRQPENNHGFIFNRVREKIIARWQTASPDGAGLMTALAVANPSGLSPQTWQDLRPLGLNHLVSISGLHIGMIGLFAAYLARWIMRFLPYTPRNPRLWTLLIGVLSASIYTGLAGAQIPALRSCIMLTVFAYTWAKRGSVSSWRTFFIALAAVLLYQPTAALSVGLYLSFGIVATLIWASSFRLPENRHTPLKTALRAQFAATLISYLASVHFFGTLPIFSPLTNAIAIPLFTWLLVPLALISSILPFDFLRNFSAKLGDATLTVLHFASDVLPEITLPHAPAALFALAVLGAFFLLLPNGLRIKPLALCAIVTFLTYTPPPFLGSLNIIAWDVGQGLAVLLQTPTRNVLFDTGTTAAAPTLIANLRAHGITHLDTLILSHHDNDHDGGFTQLNQEIEIKQIYAGQPEFYPHAEHCRDELVWYHDEARFELLTPTPQATQDNDKSCVLRVLSGSHAILLTGDLSTKGERVLLQQYGHSLRSNILILGHHGSSSSTSSTFLNTVAPDFALASSGFANAYHHPSQIVQNRLSAHRIALWRTDTQGAINFRFNEKSIQAASLAPHQFWWQKKPFTTSDS